MQKKYLLIPVFHESNHESEINLNLKLKSSEDLSRLHKKMGHNKAKVVNNMLKASGAENNILEEYKKMYACWIYCPNYQTSPCRRKSPWVQAFGMNDVWRMDVFYLNIQNETISALHIIDCFSGFGLAYVLNNKTANSIT